MLNEKQISSILKTDIPSLSIDDIHWRTQDSTPTSILFYRIGEDEKSKDLFRQRIQNTHFAWLVTNADHESRPLNSSVITEKEWPRIQKEILDLLYPLPSLKMIAVTGTNGKTTTADLVLQLGELNGKKGISIGTLGIRSQGKTLHDFGMTSPPFIDLRKYLTKFGAEKEFCVLEASSHALIQNRLFGLKFDQAGWLSFSQDHLDYHQTMEEYFAAKMLLVDYLKPSGKIFIPSSQTELYAKVARATKNVQKARVIEQKLPLFFSTSFNRNNLEVAVELVECSLSITATKDFDKITPPGGRFYIQPFESNYIVVDFAHTPDALENICQGIKEAFPGFRLKVLFGCGGDRDRTKRPLMGKIADALADEIYVTSDNPRSEDPALIIEDILKGITHKTVHKIVERPEAVKRAFEELSGHEILLLAGKGHEDYILKHGIKYPYSDISEVEKFLEEKKK